LVNTNHVFYWCGSQSKTRLDCSFWKAITNCFSCTFSSLSSPTLSPYFPNSHKTFPTLTQIVHSTVNWQINLAIDLQTPIFHLPQTVPLSCLLPTTTPFQNFAKTTTYRTTLVLRASFPSPFFFPNTHKDRQSNLHRSVPPLLPLKKNPTALCWERSHERETRKYLLIFINFFLKFSSKFHFCFGSPLFLFAEKRCRTVLGKVT
jgi:hypothetical protein